ncbi:hypothetical protein [Mesorhizobium sp. CA15]|uniref:hypothetical protein n=1 Tax=Mesorhizobium sp. CA15 TaxID=2876641 RepID=UPI001CD0AC5B|nr:hypothetical protein [Mesorhizobium sp. CA15]
MTRVIAELRAPSLDFNFRCLLNSARVEVRAIDFPSHENGGLYGGENRRRHAQKFARA